MLRYRSVVPKRAAKASAAPPRLSTMHVDEHSGARVRKARESMFAGSVNGDSDEEHEPPELQDGEDPFPAELLKQASPRAAGGSPIGREGGKAKPAHRQVRLGCLDESRSLRQRLLLLAVVCHKSAHCMFGWFVSTKPAAS
jgi:hypothetical protein